MSPCCLEETLNNSLAARNHPESGGLLRWISCQYPDIGSEIHLVSHPDPGAAHLRGLVQRFLKARSAGCLHDALPSHEA